jgi:hypothetical protein
VCTAAPRSPATFAFAFDPREIPTMCCVASVRAPSCLPAHVLLWRANANAKGVEVILTTELRSSRNIMFSMKIVLGFLQVRAGLRTVSLRFVGFCVVVRFRAGVLFVCWSLCPSSRRCVTGIGAETAEDGRRWCLPA